MKVIIRAGVTLVLLSLAASPAIAQGPPAGTPGPQDSAGAQHRPAEAPTAEGNPGSSKKLAAPGRYCKDVPKQRVEGQKGTAFSACVKAQRKLRDGKASSPGQACKGASKKRIKGEKGTPYSLCVKAAAQRLADEAAQEEPAPEQEATETAT